MNTSAMLPTLNLPLAGRAAMLDEIGREDARFFLRGDWTELQVVVHGKTHRIPRHEASLQYFIDAHLLDMTMICV